MSLDISENVGFIGGGNMAQAIGFSAISKGIFKPENVIVSAPTDNNLSVWKEKGVQTTNRNGEVIIKSSLVFIAVKPQYFFEAMKSASQDISQWNFREGEAGVKWNDQILSRTFVSIMVGCTIDQIKKVLKDCLPPLVKVTPQYKVIRVMPNTPLLVGKGFSAVCISDFDRTLIGPALDKVLKIFRAGGESEEVKESQMDAVSAISGSGPAYMYTIIEALADGGVRYGLPKALALKLAASTMAGGAAMVLESCQHPAQLRDSVCSPGGTTIAAIHSLERHGLRGALMDAVEAAVKRANELK